jgi:hypothetical protein
MAGMLAGLVPRVLQGCSLAARMLAGIRSSKDGRDARTPERPGWPRRHSLRSRWLVSLAGLELQVLRGCGLGGGRWLAGIRSSWMAGTPLAGDPRWPAWRLPCGGAGIAARSWAGGSR